MISKQNFTCIVPIEHGLLSAYRKPNRFHVVAIFIFYTLQKHTLTKVLKIYNHIQFEHHSVTIIPALQGHVGITLVLMKTITIYVK